MNVSNPFLSRLPQRPVQFAGNCLKNKKSTDSQQNTVSQHNQENEDTFHPQAAPEIPSALESFSINSRTANGLSAVEGLNKDAWALCNEFYLMLREDKKLYSMLSEDKNWSGIQLWKHIDFSPESKGHIRIFTKSDEARDRMIAKILSEKNDVGAKLESDTELSTLAEIDPTAKKIISLPALSVAGKRIAIVFSDIKKDLYEEPGYLPPNFYYYRNANMQSLK